MHCVHNFGDIFYPSLLRQNQVLEAKTCCFPNVNQVDFVAKPNLKHSVPVNGCVCTRLVKHTAFGRENNGKC